MCGLSRAVCINPQPVHAGMYQAILLPYFSTYTSIINTRKNNSSWNALHWLVEVKDAP